MHRFLCLLRKIAVKIELVNYHQHFIQQLTEKYFIIHAKRHSKFKRFHLQ